MSNVVQLPAVPLSNAAEHLISTLEQEIATGLEGIKRREQRVRRILRKQGYSVMKSRRRNPRAIDYGSYWIVDPRSNIIVAGHSNGMDLEDVEAWAAE